MKLVSDDLLNGCVLHIDGRVGICVPEAMRFNGNGFWYAENN